VFRNEVSSDLLGHNMSIWVASEKSDLIRFKWSSYLW